MDSKSSRDGIQGSVSSAPNPRQSNPTDRQGAPQPLFSPDVRPFESEQVGCARTVTVTCCCIVPPALSDMSAVTDSPHTQPAHAWSMLAYDTNTNFSWAPASNLLHLCTQQSGEVRVEDGICASRFPCWSYFKIQADVVSVCDAWQVNGCFT